MRRFRRPCRNRMAGFRSILTGEVCRCGGLCLAAYMPIRRQPMALGWRSDISTHLPQLELKSM